MPNRVPMSGLRRSRPRGITALSAFFGFGALASGVSAVSLLLPGSALEPLWRLNPRAHRDFVRMDGWSPVLLAVVCLACAAAAYGFVRGRRWGYLLGIVLLVVNLVGELLNVVFGSEPRAIFGLPVVALLLWYLASSNVRAFFESNPAQAGPSPAG